MIKKILLSFFGFLLFYIIVGDINANQSDEPMRFMDDGIEWHKNEKKYLAIENAKPTRKFIPPIRFD